MEKVCDLGALRISVCPYCPKSGYELPWGLQCIFLARGSAKSDTVRVVQTQSCVRTFVLPSAGPGQVGKDAGPHGERRGFIHVCQIFGLVVQKSSGITRAACWDVFSPLLEALSAMRHWEPIRERAAVNIRSGRVSQPRRYVWDMSRYIPWLSGYFFQ